MKFIVPIKPLQETLAKVIAVIPSKSTLPQLETVLTALKGDTLTFTGTDLEITIEASIQVSGIKDGSVNLPARLFHDIVRALPEGELTFELDSTKKRALLETAQGTYRLSVDETAELPNSATTFKADGSIPIDSTTLRSLIGRTLFAVSTDDLRPSMMGVLFQFSPDGTRAVATDGHRLVRVVNSALKSSAELDVIIPSKTLNLITKSFPEGEVVTLGFNPTHVECKSGSTTILSRLIDERYPNYEAVIPRENDKQLVIPKESLLRSVKRVMVVANPTTKQMRFQMEKDAVSLVAENFDSGNEANEKLNCDYGSDEITIGFNGRFIEDALNHLDGSDISMKFSSPTRAAIIEPMQSESEDILMLVMPVRLNG